MTKQRLALFITGGLAAVGIVVGVLALTGWFSSTDVPSGALKPVSDVDASVRACLLVAPAGSTDAQPALQGLTKAAQSRKDLLVQQFTDPANVSPASMFGELAALHCTTVVTVGSQAEAQVSAHANKATRYLVIGTPLPGYSNVTVIPTGAATSAAVESAVLRIVGS